MGIPAIPPFAPPAKFTPLFLTPQARCQPAYNGMFTNAGAAWTTCWSIESRPYMIRAVIHNHLASAVNLANGGLFAPSSSETPGYDPINAAGVVDRTLWQPFTFGGGGADVAAVDQPVYSSPPTSVTLPAGSTDAPSITYSDWMIVSPLERTDGKSYFCILTRGYDANNLPLQSCANGDAPGLGRKVRGYNSGNQVAMSSPFVSNGSNQGSAPIWPLALDVIGDGYGTTVFQGGDSIHALGADGFAGSYSHRACAALSTPARNISFESGAYPGRTSKNYLSLIMQRIRSANPPQVIIMPMWSRNDTPYSTANADYTFRQSLAVAAEARKRNIGVILTTSAPCLGPLTANYNAVNDTYRRYSDAKTRACAAQGWDVLDLDALWNDGAAAPSYKAGYNYTDYIHPSQSAHAAAGVALQPKLRKLLAI